MKDLGKWKPVVVGLQVQPEHSYKAGTERRNKHLHLSSPSTHPTTFCCCLPLPTTSYSASNWKPEDKRVYTVQFIRIYLHGQNVGQRRVENKSGEEEWGEQKITSSQVLYLLMTNTRCITTHVLFSKSLLGLSLGSDISKSQ